MSKISKTLNGIKTVSNQKSLYSSKDQNKIIKDKINYIEKAENYADYELNNIIFEEALKNDKRNFCQYYFSLIKNLDFDMSIVVMNKSYYLISLFLFI